MVKMILGFARWMWNKGTENRGAVSEGPGEEQKMKKEIKPGESWHWAGSGLVLARRFPLGGLESREKKGKLEEQALWSEENSLDGKTRAYLGSTLSCATQ